MTETRIAIAKGRLQDNALALFASAGISLPDGALESRRLLLEDTSGRFSFIFVKPMDVPVYVEYGVADAGICGRDVILESAADVHEPLDLRFGFCRLVLAAKAGSGTAPDPFTNNRVATKYPRITSEYFQRKGIPVELIFLSGSVEIAPVLGLAQHIVDLVETGRTLRDNGLVVVDTITHSTARLIVNRANYQLKRALIAGLIDRLRTGLRSFSGGTNHNQPAGAAVTPAQDQ